MAREGPIVHNWMMRVGITVVLLLLLTLTSCAAPALVPGKRTPAEAPDVTTHQEVPTQGSPMASPTDSPGGVPPSAGPPNPTSVASASEVKARYDDALLRVPGVVGTGVGLAPATGDVVIQVYVARLDDEVRQTVPDQLEGVRVHIIETGEIRAR